MPTETNNNVVKELKAITPDNTAIEAIKMISIQDAYKNLSHDEIAQMLWRKAVRGAYNAEFESKPKAQFKAKQSVDRKVGDVSTATFEDYRAKLFGTSLERINKLLSDLKTYGDK